MKSFSFQSIDIVNMGFEMWVGAWVGLVCFHHWLTVIVGLVCGTSGETLAASAAQH